MIIRRLFNEIASPMAIVDHLFDSTDHESLFATIADDLYQRGYSINPNALAEPLIGNLFQQLAQLPNDAFIDAGIGRQQDNQLNPFVRRDSIRWINGNTPAEQHWLNWSQRLRLSLNRHLFLGLFSFESHFAHYGNGDFYKKHMDAFKGESNRVLSVVLYLNPGWLPDDGGELVIYSPNDPMAALVKVTPAYGTLAVFLSEDFPHEVLPAQRDRYSIAGWFRVNNSINGQIDPPL